jgi:hypothetical protein
MVARMWTLKRYKRQTESVCFYGDYFHVDVFNKLTDLSSPKFSIFSLLAFFFPIVCVWNLCYSSWIFKTLSRYSWTTPSVISICHSYLSEKSPKKHHCSCPIREGSEKTRSKDIVVMLPPFKSVTVLKHYQICLFTIKFYPWKQSFLTVLRHDGRSSSLSILVVWKWKCVSSILLPTRLVVAGTDSGFVESRVSYMQAFVRSSKQDKIFHIRVKRRRIL